MQISPSLQNTLSAVADAARACGAKSILRGDVALKLKREQPVGNVFQIVLAPLADRQSFYDELTKSITVNYEIVSTNKLWYVVSSGFVLQFEIHDNFDYADDASKQKVTTESVYLDLQSGDYYGIPDKIKPLDENLDLGHALIIAKSVGDFSDIPLECPDFDLNNLKEPIDETIPSLLTDIILALQPGTAMQFLSQQKNGKSWLFEHLIKLAQFYNIAVSEDISVESMLGEQKTELLNIYGEFFSSQATVLEELITARESRLSTNLRLILDTPDVDIDLPFITQGIFLTKNQAEETKPSYRGLVPWLASSEAESSEFQKSIYHEGSFPVIPYAPPTCDPAECKSRNPDYPCCCCHPDSIMSNVSLRCHEKVIISCNASGDGPAPGESFPESCDECEPTCQGLLDGSIACGDIPNQAWWHYNPTEVGSCRCECHQEPAGDGPCELTCVKCGKLCSSEYDISPAFEDCHFGAWVKPSQSCCGDPGVIDIMFVIELSDPMLGYIDQVKTSIYDLVNKAGKNNIQVRLAITTFHQSQPNPHLRLQFTYSVERFIESLNNITIAGSGVSADMMACQTAALDGQWFASDRYLFLIANSDSEILEDESKESAAKYLQANYIKVFSIDTPSVNRKYIVNATGGVRFGFGRNFDALVDIINITAFPTSCDCLENEWIPILHSREECIDFDLRIPRPELFLPENSHLLERCMSIPIHKCNEGEDCDDICGTDIVLWACGQTITIEPQQIRMTCCEDFADGYGCRCHEEQEPGQCCGPSEDCDPVCDPILKMPIDATVEDAIDRVWCNCYDKAQLRDPVTCDSCCCPTEPHEDLIGHQWFPCWRLRELVNEGRDDLLHLLDEGRCCDVSEDHRDDCCNLRLGLNNGLGSIDWYDRSTIEAEVRLARSKCKDVPIVPDFECPEEVLGAIDCIVPNDSIPDDTCNATRDGSGSVMHPATVVLNNGIGLVAYEIKTGENKFSNIRIEQFKTTASHKILPNRIFGFGRLEHNSKWGSYQANTAKFYFYEPISPRATGVDTNPDPEDWGDSITFVSGPLQNQCFPLAIDPESSSVIGSDNFGSYLLFHIPTTQVLSDSFPSTDDVYNVQFFISDKEDQGLIGNSPDSTTSVKDYAISNLHSNGEEYVTQLIRSIEHLHNGEPVPVANPSLTAAKNYQNHIENSHHVFLTYQAMEDGKWNIYLRQLRLSEYEKDQQIWDVTEPEMKELSTLGIYELIYRIVCVHDTTTEIGEDFVCTRSAVAEILISDGRDVLNNISSGYWDGICPDLPDRQYPKKKVYAKLTHSAVTDAETDFKDRDEIFYQWQVGEEYSIPIDVDTESGLFSLLKRAYDSAVPVGVYDLPVEKGKVYVKSSSVTASWFRERSDDYSWYAMVRGPLDMLEQIMGLDIGEPIMISDNDYHAMNPCVGITHNNDVYIAYEKIVDGIPQIVLKGTSTPSSSLPSGVIVPNDLDASLSYFLNRNDFEYTASIASTGVNQSPDIYIDLNDVVHITWQSNAHKDWEIYYAKSDTNFANQRITKSEGKSLHPRISGDNLGHTFIVWHDDRYGNWEIMLAYNGSERLLPYSQQDPYWAGVRNAYDHHIDEVPILITNDSDEDICFSRLYIRLYQDRLLTSSPIIVDQHEYPFAFESDDGKVSSNSSTYTYSSFNDWVTQEENAGLIVLVGPEYDSTLSASSVSRFKLSMDNTDCSFEISFRASDDANDGDADFQWTQWAPVDKDNLGKWMDYSSLNVSATTGRYKQSKIQITFLSTSCESGSLSIESVSSFFLCLQAHDSATLTFKMLPEIKVSTEGNETADVPLPLLFEQNNTYFMSVYGISNENKTVFLGSPQSTISCYSCARSTKEWDHVSCTLLITVDNDDSSFNADFDIHFYSDKDLVYEIDSFSTTDNIDYFVMSDGSPAEAYRSSDGFVLDGEGTFHLMLYPPISNTSGLLCGIYYWVTIDMVKRDGTTRRVDTSRWSCDCNSERWQNDSQETKITRYDRWHSSASGFSDIRLTETDFNNQNPVLKIKNNFWGVVLYETDRDETSQIYASVFRGFPDYHMFATGAEAVVPPIDGSVLVRSDIDLESRGINLDYSLDRYDNLFLAVQDPGESVVDSFSKRQFITVYRKGIKDLVFESSFSDFPDEDQETPTAVSEDECVPKITCYAYDEDPLIQSIVKEVRVQNNYVRYHITRSSRPVPVVQECSIKFEVVGTPEVASVRLRNGEDDWSEWLPFGPEIGGHTAIVPWTLTKGSGIKNVTIQFATYAGLSGNIGYTLVADYERLPYSVNIYKPVRGAEPPAWEDPIIWNRSNRVSIYNKIFPVASLEDAVIVDNSISQPDSSILWIEIVPYPVSSIFGGQPTEAPIAITGNMDVLFVVDTSGSMDMPLNGSTRLDIAKSMMKNAVASMLVLHKCDYQIGIQSIDGPRISGGFSSDGSVIFDAIDSITTSGSSQYLHDYLNNALSGGYSWRDDAKKTVIYISDTTGDSLTQSMSDIDVESMFKDNSLGILVSALDLSSFDYLNNYGSPCRIKDLGSSRDMGIGTIEDVQNVTFEDLSAESEVATNFCSNTWFVSESSESSESSSFSTSELPDEITFDFIHQGINDQLGQTAYAVKSNGRTVYRSYVVIGRDGLDQGYSDGLATIIPYFKNDCSITIPDRDEVKDMVVSQQGFSSIGSRVDFNILVQQESANLVSPEDDEVVKELTDPWSVERDDLGRIKHKIVIRPQEDPYFVFGDPNYRLEGNERS